MFMRLVAAAERERYTLSDYVRLLVNDCQRKQNAQHSAGNHAETQPPLSFDWFRTCE